MLYRAYCKASKIPLQQRLEEAADAVRPVDWARVIADLADAGMPMRRVALIIDVSQPTVAGWRNGSIPNYESGVKLLEAHAVATGKPTPTKKAPNGGTPRKPGHIIWPDPVPAEA